MSAIRNVVLTLVLSCTALAGCTQAPDLTAVQSERAKPVQRYDVAQAAASNGTVAVAGTQSGVVLLSKDEGKTWNRLALGAVSIIGLAVCPDGSFVGIDFNHKVWSANAQGADWKSVALDKPRTPLAVTCDAQGRWWVAGSGTKIAGSADHGATWQVGALDGDAQLTTLQFVDDHFAVALGEFGLVVTSVDGGATWQKGAKIPNDFYPYAALFVDAKVGYASGIAGQILKTQDGGKTWSKIDNQTNAALFRLFLHDGRPYGVGAGGVVARLDGDAFRTMPYPDAVPVPLGAAAALPNQNAVAIGGPGGLIRVIGTQVN